MAQHTGRQYDDDLTVGADEYNESFSTDYVDLFEPLGDNDAPIAKLKTIILSIDWEINDDILHQLNDELQDLKDVWAGNKINLIYVQALEKIGRYIFSERANAHPNAIKLLLAFYYDLEKIVSSASMSEEEKKQLLLQDVKRFDQFKLQIAPASKEKHAAAESLVAARAQVVVPAVDVALPSSQGQRNVLTNLKAIVLGIDWEISDSELVRLSEEVSKLEKVFSENRAKLIFLQGIGALANYIRSAKSNAHPDAFKLLHSFCTGLEKTYNEVLSADQEKEILLAEVEKFNTFKSVIATVATEVVVPVDDAASLAGERDAEDEEESDEESGVFAPAFADMPEGVRGFREDIETIKSDVDKSVASFLGEEEAVAEQSVIAVGGTFASAVEGPDVSSRLDALFGNTEEPELVGAEVSAVLALSGVEVETEADDDSDEEALLLQAGSLAPALAETSGQSVYAEAVLSKNPLVDSSFAGTPVVPGVDVETEADDESGEAALPREEGGVAPALAFSDETYGFRETEFAADPDEEEFDLEDRLHSFFGAEIEEASQGSAFHVAAAVHEEVLPAETFSEKNHVSKSEEREPAGLAGEQKVFTSALAATEEVEPTVADVIFEGESAGRSAEARSGSLEVVFEPVDDDVPVDELPVEPESGAIDYGTLEQKAFIGIRECVSSILLKKYEIAFPAFFVEINRLRQGWRQAQYVENAFLQLLLTVGEYIDTYRTVADAEALTLLQSLCDRLEQVCQEKTGPGDGREQILFKETGTVLLWQQRLIAALMARHEGEATSSGDVDDLTDLFSEK